MIAFCLNLILFAKCNRGMTYSDLYRILYPFDKRYSLESIHVVMSGIELCLSQRYHIIKMSQQSAINLLEKTRHHSWQI